MSGTELERTNIDLLNNPAAKQVGTEKMAIPSDALKRPYSKNPKYTLKRANHNELERKRRHHQKTKLNELKEVIPGLQLDKLSTLAIIQKAKEYILTLRSINTEQAQMIAFLRRKTPNIMLSGPNMMPQHPNMMPMNNMDSNIGMNNLGMFNYGMYPNAINPMVLPNNPMLIPALPREPSSEALKSMPEQEKHIDKRKDTENETKGISSAGQISQRSSGSDNVPSLPSNEGEWIPHSSFDSSMMGLDPSSIYLLKRRSFDQDFDSMMRVRGDGSRRDSFNTMFEVSPRPSDGNIIPINPYHKESFSAFYNYGFYNPEDKGFIP